MRIPHFLTSLVTRLVCEVDNIHQLEQPLVYESGLLDRMVSVPSGFKTDFASVPRLPFAYMVVGGKGQRAAVIHDWLYSGGLDVSRRLADQVFREALLATGHSAFVAGLMYAGVRIGGGAAFSRPNVPQPEHVARVIEQAPSVDVVQAP